MERIVNNLNNADKNTKKALKEIEEAASRIERGQYHVTNNIYTEGGNVTVDKLGEAINYKTVEAELLRDIVKHLERIIEVKDAQIQLMLDTLTDNKKEIERLRAKLDSLNEN